MAYTVKKLSNLSGISVRTLHFYEELGLLKPAYYGSNGYRYYEAHELLQLQQILFFKELGLTLKQIQKILNRSDFDQLLALHSHREALSREKKKIDLLIKTIDKTIHHLKGSQQMQDKEMFKGFYEWANNKGEESYFIGRVSDIEKCETTAEKIVLKSVKKSPPEKREKLYWENLEKKTQRIYGAIAKCLEEGYPPGSPEVQDLIENHYTFAGEFHETSQEVYRALAELYRTHPAYQKQLDFFHPRLKDFMPEAMEIFASQILS